MKKQKITSNKLKRVNNNIDKVFKILKNDTDNNWIEILMKLNIKLLLSC
jgi:hypothetical protein